MSDAKRAEKLILMVIEGNVYECSAYVPQHPGEGIRGINLSQFRFKNTTREFDQFHNDNEAMEILMAAQAAPNGHDLDTGVRFIGPNPFSNKRRMPKYYYAFFDDEKDADELDRKPLAELHLTTTDATHVVYGAGETVQLCVRGDNNTFEHLELERKDGKWTCAAREDVESEEQLEKFVDKLAPSK